MTPAQIAAHQARHFGEPLPVQAKAKPRMNKTETEYSLVLEAMKRRHEIVEYRFEGISLSWGLDPETEKPMWYTPDFYVVVSTATFGAPIISRPLGLHQRIKLIEVKGPHIYEKDWIRFKGARSDWPQFRFELHQKTKDGWRQVV